MYSFLPRHPILRALRLTVGLLLLQESHEKALRHCRKAAKLSPNSPEVHHYVGEMLMNMERFDEAMEKFEDAIKVQRL